MRRAAFSLTALSVAAFALASCANAAPSADPTTAPPTMTPVPSVTVAPIPTESTPPLALPTDCAQVGSAATRAATVDQLTLQGDGTGFVRPAPPEAALVLGCDWFAGDATGYLLLLSTTDPASADAYIATLPAEGWTCGARGDAGRLCTMTTPNAQYPVDTVETVFTEGDVWIYQSASNTDGEALLTDLLTSIFQA